MGNVYRLVEKSLFFNLITFIFKPEVYEGSFFYNWLSTLSGFISRTLKGSLLRTFFTNRRWEKEAIRSSCFMTILAKLYIPINRFVIFINNSIENSYPFKVVLMAVESFITTPLSTLAYIFLPAVFLNTTLKAIFESFTPKALVYRIMLMMALFIMTSINIPLRWILFSSRFCKLCEWFSGEKVESISLESRNSTTATGAHYVGKSSFVFIGMLGGILYYFLPATTFIKLFGLIFISTAIYIWPWVGLALTSFMLPLASTSYSVAIIGLTFISVLLNHQRYKRVLPAAIVPAWLFMASAAIAAIFSIMRAESLKALPLYAAYFMVFYAASVLLKDAKTIKIIIFTLIVSTLILSFFGIYQYFFVKIPTAEAWVDVEQFPELATRVYATLENPNVLGEYLGLTIPLVLGLFWASGKFRQKSFLAIIIVVLTLCLILTFSRGAWLGLAMSFIVFAILKEPRLLVLILVVAILSPMFLPSVVTNRIASIGSLEDSSNAYRVTIWIAALRMIKDYWLNGVGLGLMAFSRVYRDYMVAGASAIHAHNLYLEIGLEMGIIGLFALLWMAVRGFSEALTGIGGKCKTSYVLAGIVAALVGHLLHGLFDYVWYSPRIVLAFWMFFGMMSALTNNVVNNDMTGEKSYD